MSELTQHWNDIFAAKADEQLGWYEADVGQTLKFVDALPNLASARLFLAGGGTTLLADALVRRCQHVVLNDISSVALEKMRLRLRTAENLTCLQHDLSTPLPAEMAPVDLWVDRAVLHFLLPEESINVYFESVRDFVVKNGHVLLAEFSPDGAPKCAGLELHRYSVEEMSQRLGDDFGLLQHEQHIYTNPFGAPRPYTYGLFQRKQGGPQPAS